MESPSPSNGSGPDVFDDDASRKLLELFDVPYGPPLHQVQDLLDSGADPNAIHCKLSTFDEYIDVNECPLAPIPAEFGPHVPCFIHITWNYFNIFDYRLGLWNLDLLYTPLLQAIHHEDLDMLELLLAKGAHLHLAPHKISSAVFKFSASYYSPFFNKAYDSAGSRHLSLLLSADDAKSELEMAWLFKGLRDALDSQSHSCVKMLIDYTYRAWSYQPSWAFPFQDLPSETVAWIVDNPDLWIPLSRIKSSLLFFMISENRPFLKTIVDWGKNLEATNFKGRRALHMATGHSSTEMCRHLIIQGANVCARDRTGATPLVHAVFYGHEAAVNFLVTQGNTLMNSDRLNWKAFFQSHGLNRILPDKSSILHLAGMRGFLAVSKRLIEAGVDMTYPNSEGLTVIDVAVQNQHWDVCFGLLKETTLSTIQPNTASLILDKAIAERRNDVLAFFLRSSRPVRHSMTALVNIYEQGQKQAPLIEKLVKILEEATSPYCGATRVWKFCSKCACLIESLWNRSNPRVEMTGDPLNSQCPLCHLCCDTWNHTFTDEPDLTYMQRTSFYLKRTENESAKTKILHVHAGDKVQQHQILKIPDQWHHVLEKTNHMIDGTTKSHAAFEMASQWLKCCVGSHEKCTFEQKAWKPTRLLDLADFNHKNQIKLVSTEMVDEPYVALSHRWGTEEMPRTTFTNYSMQMNGISTCELSKTMQDAMVIVTTLGFRYLWIDALCIIQDSHEDWLAEAAKMGAVFNNALFTIAAADSENHSQGIFRKRIAGCLRPFHVDNFHKIPYRDRSVYGEGDGELYVFPDTPKVRKDGRPKGPLDTRAWVLQEQILSPRTLYYGNGELHWECLILSASESSPLGISLLNDINSDETWAFRILRKAIVGSIEASFLQSRIAEIWKYVISNYSRRHLTKGKDKLMAIEGILSSVSNIIQEEHIAGMWPHKLWSQLLWWTDTSLLDRTVSCQSTFSAPTWSWLSANTPVFYHNSLHEVHDSGSRPFTELQQVSYIEACETDIIARDSCITGSLVLTGPCFNYRLTSNDFKQTVFKRWNQKALGLNTGKWWLDQSIDLPQDITCIVVAEDDVAKALVCLCLVASEDNSDPTTEYKRIGLCHWEGLEYQVNNYAKSELEERTVIIL